MNLQIAIVLIAAGLSVSNAQHSSEKGKLVEHNINKSKSSNFINWNFVATLILGGVWFVDYS